MESMKADEFAAHANRDGYGYGDGYGDGSGDGSGYGDGSGSGDGDGYGYGDGSGDGSGSGDGDGYGYGDGSGDGSGYGDGYGYGDGSGDGSSYGSGEKIASISGQKIYDIDGVPTAIYRVKGNIAKGAILQSDLTFTPCFVVKQDVYFAHGDTLHEAMEALRDKLFEDLPEEERIEAFVAEHQPGVEYPNRDLFDWHHRLTGSCEAGRKAFVADRGLDMNGSTTPEEFVHLTRNAYGGEVIRKLEAHYHVD